MSQTTWIFWIDNPTSPVTRFVEVLAPSESAARVKARKLLEDEEGVGDLLKFDEVSDSAE